MASIEFFIDTIGNRPHYGPGVYSASNRNEYQQYFLWGKGRQPYHLHVPTVRKSGSLNLLEPSGPVQTGNGIVIPYVFRLMKIHISQYLAL